MKNIFDLAEACLHNADIQDKVSKTHLAWKLYQAGELSFEARKPPADIELTKFPERPKLLAPRQMPHRKLSSPEGIAAFFHALAHIEFIAIYLAWDILYRFRGMPQPFYQDWLQVADEETQHFTLITNHLSTLGWNYGDLPAHGGLWDHAQQTAGDLLVRLAIVPRCMEARGLDVTPAMIKKFQAFGDIKAEAILTRILTDEVGHVAIGSKWFNFQCEELALSPEDTYINLISKFYKGKPKGPFNRKMRIISGFSKAELDWLESNSYESR